MRNLLDKELYPLPFWEQKGNDQTIVDGDDHVGPFRRGRRMMEYVVVPRARKGLNGQWMTGTTIKSTDEIREHVASTGALDIIRNETNVNNEDDSCDDNTNGHTDMTLSSPQQPSLVFTGTGSAIPCKYRNVTGMCLQTNDESTILLDCGEGTVGQLMRTVKTTKERLKLLRTIRLVWVSHPHADHHLGLARLLSERKAIMYPSSDDNHQDNENDADDDAADTDKNKLILVAPMHIRRYLLELEAVNSAVRNTYIHVDCASLDHGNITDGLVHCPDRIHRLLASMGIQRLTTVPVAHCPFAFAIILETATFGKVAYSGDCRPSMRFADAATGADLLIHEATFESGMEQEAVLKKHSTTGEALSVAARMKAKAIVLTHFSQRYPRIPPLETKITAATATTAMTTTTTTTENTTPSTATVGMIPIVFAFDMMKLTPSTILRASRITPALRALYPENDDQTDDKTENDNRNEADDGKKRNVVDGAEDGVDRKKATDRKDTNTESAVIRQAMAIPGIFANQDLL